MVYSLHSRVVNPFTVVINPIFWDQGWCLVLRAVLKAPVTPAHRSKASGGRDWVPPRGPKASLGSLLGRFDDPPERWPLP